MSVAAAYERFLTRAELDRLLVEAFLNARDETPQATWPPPLETWADVAGRQHRGYIDRYYLVTAADRAAETAQRANTAGRNAAQEHGVKRCWS